MKPPKKLGESIILDIDYGSIDLIRKIPPFGGTFRICFDSIYLGMGDLLSPSSAAVFHKVIEVLKSLESKGRKIFLDTGLCGDRETVGNASASIANLKLSMFSVDEASGQRSIREAVANKGDSKLALVSVLNRINPDDCWHEYDKSPNQKIKSCASTALNLGVDAVICPLELIDSLREDPKFKDLSIICPMTTCTKEQDFWRPANIGVDRFIISFEAYGSIQRINAQIACGRNERITSQKPEQSVP